jgi:hypothetical protein
MQTHALAVDGRGGNATAQDHPKDTAKSGIRRELPWPSKHQMDKAGPIPFEDMAWASKSQ